MDVLESTLLFLSAQPLIVETKIRIIFLLSKYFLIFIYYFKRLILRGFIGDYI
jgi:hypothetical protein